MAKLVTVKNFGIEVCDGVKNHLLMVPTFAVVLKFRCLLCVASSEDKNLDSKSIFHTKGAQKLAATIDVFVHLFFGSVQTETFYEDNASGKITQHILKERDDRISYT